MRHLIVAVTVFIALPFAASAQTTSPALPDSGPHISLIVQGTLEYGGDDLVTLRYDDGSDQKIKAGTGLSAGAGVHFKPSEYSPFDVRLTAGYKYTGSYARNADVYLDRVTAELVGDYRFYKGFWAGGGVIHHFSPKLHGDGYAPDIRFDDATGFTVEAGWRFVGLSYRNIRYTANGYNGNADASSIGVLFKYGF